MRPVLALFLLCGGIFGQETIYARFRSSGGGGNVFTPVSNAIVSSTPGTTQIVTVLTNNPGTGHMVVVGCSTYNNGLATAPTLTSLVDSNSNSYTIITGTGIPAGGFGTNNYNGFVFGAWLPSAPANATNTLTATFSSTTGGYGYCFPAESSYTGPTPTLDGAIGTNGTTTCSLPAIPVSGSNDYAYSIATVNGSMAGITSGLTEIGSVQSSSWAAGYNLSVNSNLTPEWNLSSGCGGSSYLLAGVGFSFK